MGASNNQISMTEDEEREYRNDMHRFALLCDRRADMYDLLRRFFEGPVTADFLTYLSSRTLPSRTGSPYMDGANREIALFCSNPAEESFEYLADECYLVCSDQYGAVSLDLNRLVALCASMAAWLRSDNADAAYDDAAKINELLQGGVKEQLCELAGLIEEETSCGLCLGFAHLAQGFMDSESSLLLGLLAEE